jgi:carboxyl-terminal processing protease
MMKMKYNRFFLITLLSLSMATGTFRVLSQDVIPNAEKFGRLLRLIDAYYVDTTNIGKLTEVAIVSVLQDLDPHSVYISKADVDKMNEPLVGNFEGIGITFNIFRDTLLVTSVVPGGPSEKNGIQAGDRILFIDGKNVAGIGLTNNDVFAKLRGPKGTKVELKVQRSKVKELLDFTIIRDKIPLNSLDASYMLDNETGYIKLSRFSATSSDEFRIALNELKKSNLKNLILDLRNNGGGYMKAATDLAEEFLPANRLIVYTEGVKSPKREYKSSGNGIFEEGKLVILTNEGTASASEIVSGAIQDWDRGIIIGRRTYGKGLVQNPFILTDGSQVRLTTAHYYTPSGRCIQRPYKNGVKEYRSDYQKRIDNGELFHADSIHYSDSVKYKTLSSGRTVYGGGGIIPDIFVPLDTSSLYRYYNLLQRSNVLYNFVLEYIDQNRVKLLKQYPVFQKFNSGFSVNDDMIETMIKKGEKENITRDQESIQFTRPVFKKEIKAYIARDLYATKYFFQVYNEDDTTIKKALEIIRNKEQYAQTLVSK